MRRLPQVVKLFFTFALPAIISSQSIAIETRSLRRIITKKVFETSVPYPNQLTTCGGSVWAFSETEQSLFRLNPLDGKILGHFPVINFDKESHGSSVDVAALACQMDQLYLLVNLPKKRCDLGV